MKLPRPTIRRLMLVVVLASLVLGAWAWVERRRARFERLAADHERRFFAYSMPVRSVPSTAGLADLMKLRLARATYHIDLSVKYRWAASYPWRPVPADPPEPPEPPDEPSETTP